MKNFPNIRAAIYGEPWMTTELGLATIIAVAENAISGGPISAEFAEMQKKPIPPVSERYRVENGVAIIPISGSLVPHADLFSRMSGATSYDSITAMFNDAMDRQDVVAIALLIDSLGGAVMGCFECADNIAAGSEFKKVISVIEGNGCSAAYLLASQAEYVVCTETSNIGSIGVIVGVNDSSRREKNEGNDSMIFRSKELKAPGVGPMTPNQMQSIQKRMMQLDGKFEDVVKSARPNIKPEAFSGESFIGVDERTHYDAISFGLVDAVESLDDVIKLYGERILV